MAPIEQAPINADGSLGAFNVSGSHLVVGRRNFTSAALGNYLYALGGTGSTGDLASVERASINSDGSLGAFETVSDVSLVAAGFDQAFVLVGGNLYATGGLQNLVPSNTVQVATVDGDGNLGNFAAVPGLTLATARGTHTANVIGNELYVLGGLGKAFSRA